MAVGSIKGCAIKISEFSVDNNIVTADESYSLSVDETGSCTISSQTVWGALRAMETFTQLLTREKETNNVILGCATVSINDTPRFGHRGLLIDTARHYIPIETIKTVLDSMPMSKLNVLHWHVVDAESFPLNTPSVPTMKDGAFTTDLIYSMEDLQVLKSYAFERGVQLIIELDIPGHAASWTKGKPQIMADCFVKYSYNINDFALNPTLSDTFTAIEAIMSDVITATQATTVHLGGDEVVYGCWREDAGIVQYMADNAVSSFDQLLSQFVSKVDGIMASLIRSPQQTTIHWEEVFTAGAASGLLSNSSNTIFQVWTDSNKVNTVTAAGYRVIASPSNYWYLNNAANTWKVMYSYDPTVGLATEATHFVIGGEAAMWGETVDDTNLVSTVYPRLAAVAERLWSGIDVVDLTDAERRLLIQRCRMLARGFAASPVKPGYCDTQYV